MFSMNREKREIKDEKADQQVVDLKKKQLAAYLRLKKGY